MYRIGIDLGGTKVEGIVVDEDNKELFRKRTPNGKEKGYEHVIETVGHLYKDLVGEINDAPHTLGLGMPGSISKKTGLLKNCNIQFMNGKPFVEDLQKVCGHNVRVENDANCFAMAEAIIGAGKGKGIVFGVIIGTGCGGGLVIDGKVIKGLSENTGEWGHSTINYNDGAKWASGIDGVVEAYISGTGVQERYKEKWGEELSMTDIVFNYRHHDDRATPIMNDFFEHFGIAMSNLIKFLDPDVIVLGGGLSNVDEVYSEGLERVKKYVFHNDLYTPIVKNEYGDSAGVYGAALIGIN